MKDKNNKFNIKNPIDRIKDISPTSHRGINTIISVALLVLVAVGFIVAFQQIGTNIIGSVEQPVQANIEASQSNGEVDLVVQSMSDNVDTMQIRVNDQSGGDASVEESTGDLNASFSGDGAVSVGDSATVGDSDGSGSGDPLESGDEVIVVARDNPDNTAVVLNHEYE